jgi:hypothetical protein
MAKRILRLVDDNVRLRAMEAIRDSPDGYVVTIAEPTRTLEQNSLLWPLLTAFSQQLDWPVNGVMCKLEPDEWKHILSAAFKQELARVTPGINGGMVMLGARTSKMGKGEFSEFIAFIYSVAAERGVTTE